MQVGIIDCPEAFSDYTIELLRAWGLRSLRRVTPAALHLASTPVVVVPVTDIPAEPLIAHAQAGGTVISMCPGEALAAAAGLQCRGAKAMPALLRMTAHLAPGTAGEMLPIVGRALDYVQDETATVLGYLCQADDPDSDSGGITRTTMGAGQIICLAFDLPRCVMMLRQGDPALAEWIPPDDTAVRPSHLACRLPNHDAGWIPYADLLGLLLLDLIAGASPAPMPLVSHLPDEAPAILLYSGDEDNADPEETRAEFDWLTARGLRMDLNLIPDTTPTTSEMLAQYARHHDFGPHPNLRPLDGEDLATRLADFERQLLKFTEMYDLNPLCLRNHSVCWAGYTEIVEVMERHGLRMDTNYTSGNFRIGRNYAPYSTFGGAMPVRFCRPDGRLHEVFQLHTQIMDDVWFAPDVGVYKRSSYSYRFAPEAFEGIIERIVTDMTQRLHTPLTVCIHPSNWARFSSDQGKALVQHALRQRVPVWSVTEWCRFWMARDSWELTDLHWDGAVLRARATGGEAHDSLRIMLPATHGGLRLRSIMTHGEEVPFTTVSRYRSDRALCAMPAGCEISAHYS